MEPATLAVYQADRKALSTGRQYKPKDGDNVVRLLPQPAGVVPPVIYKAVKTHFGVGANKRATECLREKNEACAVCDYMDAQSSVNAAVPNWSPDSGFEFHVLDLTNFDANDPEYIIQVWRASPYQTRQILGHLTDPQWGDLSHPDTGKVCKINKDPKTGKCLISFQPQAFPIAIQKCKYPELRTPHTYEQQQQIIQGIDPNDSSTPAAMPVATPAAAMPAVATMPTPAVVAVPPGAVPIPNVPPAITTTINPPAIPQPITVATPPAAPGGIPAPAPILQPQAIPVVPVAIPAAATPPPVPAPIANIPPVMADTTSYWCHINGSSKSMTGDEIRAHIKESGVDAATLSVMNQADEAASWKYATDFDLG